MNYKIIDENNITYDFKIEQIIDLIKKNLNKKFYKFIDNTKIEINNKIVSETQFICHRVNSSEELNKINKQFGTEIDIRDDNKSGKLILAHDPFVNGEYFEDYLQKYKHNTLILNIKSERIELDCLKLLEKYNIKNYFFLDSSFPMIYLLNKNYQNNQNACRFSEFENLQFFLENKDMFSTVWVDCFTKFPLNKENYALMNKEKKNICIVSPELQKQPEKIEIYRNYIIENKIIPTMICTKIYHIINWI
jgi:hypothetical protein